METLNRNEVSTQLLGDTRYILLTPYGSHNCRLVVTNETCLNNNTIVVIYTHVGHLGFVMIVGYVIPSSTIKVVVMGVCQRDGTQYLDNASVLTPEQKKTFQGMRNTLFVQEAEHKPKPIHLDLNIVILSVLIPFLFIKIEMVLPYAWKYNHYYTNATLCFCLFVAVFKSILDGKFNHQITMRTLEVCLRTIACIMGLGMLVELAVQWVTGATMVVPWFELSVLWVLYELSGLMDVDFHIAMPF